mgnify:CR=1 FL=1
MKGKVLLSPVVAPLATTAADAEPAKLSPPKNECERYNQFELQSFVSLFIFRTIALFSASAIRNAVW